MLLSGSYNQLRNYESVILRIDFFLQYLQVFQDLQVLKAFIFYFVKNNRIGQKILENSGFLFRNCQARHNLMHRFY